MWALLPLTFAILLFVATDASATSIRLEAPINIGSAGSESGVSAPSTGTAIFLFDDTDAVFQGGRTALWLVPAGSFTFQIQIGPYFWDEASSHTALGYNESDQYITFDSTSAVAWFNTQINDPFAGTRVRGCPLQGGCFNQHQFHGTFGPWQLVTVPEPRTAVLLATGLLGLSHRSRRR